MDHLTAAQLAWQPRLDEQTLRLCDVYHSMPRNSADSVPWLVKALENPASPIALPGAVDLFSHDCIHALLGRGLLPQDEAFVLGFTMGTAPRLRPWEVELFRFCAERLYQAPYRFSRLDGEVFAFGVAAGRLSGAASLAEMDFRRCFEQPLGTVRHALGLETEFLSAVYELERVRWSRTRASTRLPCAYQ